MADFETARFNPMQLIAQWWPEADTSHITYDPKMRSADREYWRTEQCDHDGTLLITIQMLQAALLPLLQKRTYCKTSFPANVVDIRYTIGKIRMVTVYGRVCFWGGGPYPGQRERVRIPVKCEYIVAEEQGDD